MGVENPPLLFSSSPKRGFIIYENPEVKERVKAKKTFTPPQVDYEEEIKPLEHTTNNLRKKTLRVLTVEELEKISQEILRIQKENQALKEKLHFLRLYFLNLYQKQKEIVKFQLPVKEFGQNYNTTFTKTYIVKKGDTLWSIAGKKKVYGDPYKWLLLYHANRDQIYDPDIIFPGMVLLVPYIQETILKDENKR